MRANKGHVEDNVIALAASTSNYWGCTAQLTAQRKQGVVNSHHLLSEQAIHLLPPVEFNLTFHSSAAAGIVWFFDERVKWAWLRQLLKLCFFFFFRDLQASHEQLSNTNYQEIFPPPGDLLLIFSLFLSVCFWTSAVKNPKCIWRKLSFPAIGAQPQNLITPPVVLLFTFQQIWANTSITSACHSYIKQHFFGVLWARSHAGVVFGNQTRLRQLRFSEVLFLTRWKMKAVTMLLSFPVQVWFFPHSYSLQLHRPSTYTSALVRKHEFTEMAASLEAVMQW